MKKYIITGITILIILFIQIGYCYAVDDEFFAVSKTEITKYDTLEMTIELEKIKYDKFIFKLTSDQGISNVEVTEQIENTDENNTVQIQSKENEITIEIDKQQTSLSQIKLYYKIEENLDIEKILLTATIINAENDEEQEQIQKEITIIEEDDDDDEKEPIEEKELTEDNKSENNQSEDNKLENDQSEEIKQQENNNEQNKTVATIQSNSEETKVSTTSMYSNTEKETVTYNGSGNNYLATLSISNYSLNKEFSKENATYFVTVENDVESLEIITQSEDEDATICIYGNENLQEGSNKILISVTAENGNVRNYRIYVTKNN